MDHMDPTHEKTIFYCFYCFYCSHHSEKSVVSARKAELQQKKTPTIWDYRDFLVSNSLVNHRWTPRVWQQSTLPAAVGEEHGSWQHEKHDTEWDHYQRQQAHNQVKLACKPTWVRNETWLQVGSLTFIITYGPEVVSSGPFQDLTFIFLESTQ